MDISEEYIRQCDYKEIQEHREPTIEKMPDGRWHKEWQFKKGDVFHPVDNSEDNNIEVLGTTIYNPYSFYDRGKGDIYISYVGYDEGGEGYSARKIIWLPRQDQIQEMIGESQNCRYLLKRLNEWAIDYCYGWMLKASMEQFWLTFYMWEKHKKMWNGKEWIEKKENNNG